MTDITASFVLMGIGWGGTFLALLLFYLVVTILMKVTPPDKPEEEA